MGHTNEAVNCDKEPVSFISAVQSFGALIAVEKETELITHASLNISNFTGKSVDELLGKKASEVLPLSTNDQVNVRLINSSNTKIYEYEQGRGQESMGQGDFLKELEYLQYADDLNILLDRVAEVIADRLKMDRTMVYKFHEDLHGEVVAERVNPGVDSFLGLHYPASDIPLPAREVFLSNWIRIIPDRSAEVFPIKTLSGAPLDLTDSLVRAVSPIHLEYLRNMGVASSVTVSLKVNGKLWGLITCSHLTPRTFTPSEREFCEILGRFVSVLIYEAQRKIEDWHRKKQSEIYKNLLENLHSSDNFPLELTKSRPNLMDLVSCSGVAMASFFGNEWVTLGNVPSSKDLDLIVEWLVKNDNSTGIFYTNALSELIPETHSFSKLASGLLAIKLPTTEHSYIFWFREEYIKSVTWGGRPDEKTLDEKGKLSPRRSFAAWKETVKGKSRSWNTWDVEVVKNLRNDIIALNLNRQFLSEQQARAEAEQAVKSREELISIVSHDLKNPLSSVLISTKLIEKQLSAEQSKLKTFTQIIHRSAEVMNSLINDILNVTKIETGNFHLDLEVRDINEVIEDALEILRPIAQSKSIKIDFHPMKECLIHYDSGRILQVLSNLVGNAIKFTEDEGVIIIRVAEVNRDEIQISVSDTGPGIPKGNLPFVFDRFWQAKQTSRMGTGLGLAIAKGIITAHKGRIWAESELNKGSCFFFTLPNI